MSIGKKRAPHQVCTIQTYMYILTMCCIVVKIVIFYHFFFFLNIKKGQKLNFKHLTVISHYECWQMLIIVRSVMKYWIGIMYWSITTLISFQFCDGFVFAMLTLFIATICEFVRNVNGQFHYYVFKTWPLKYTYVWTGLPFDFITCNICNISLTWSFIHSLYDNNYLSPRS